MDTFLAAIVDDDQASIKRLLRTDASLTTARVATAKLYDAQIFHWLYVGDTALHLAAAGYRVEIMRLLLNAGADPNAAMNHRRGRPLHYAADGFITGPAWDAKKQVEAIACLLNAGADVNAQDKNGASPLHRAVRTRCVAAVGHILNAGGNPTLKNKSGSTPFHLAVQNTGRGGSGAEEAREAQQLIVKEFLTRRVSSSLQDGKGKSVSDCATSVWIQKLLTEKPDLR